MDIGILGTGDLAVTLGTAWARAGHFVRVTGRNAERAAAAAQRIGSAAASVDARDFPGRADVVVIAVAWQGMTEALALIGAPSGALTDLTVIDCTNPIDFATGRVIPETGSSAEFVASLAPGAHVVKALHLFAGASWPFTGDASSSPVVGICGNDPDTLRQTAALVADLGGRAAVLGGLDAARQVEETAGFVMRVVTAGLNPRFAVPDVDPALFATGG